MASARIVASRAFASMGTKVARPAVRASFASTAAKRTITSMCLRRFQLVLVELPELPIDCN